jgi:heme O synthase-like polyprenyltransferase
MAKSQKRGRRRKSITYLWIAALAIVTVFLIYKEMTALLYILATLGVTAILLVVANADLSRGEIGSGDSAQSR